MEEYFPLASLVATIHLLQSSDLISSSLYPALLQPSIEVIHQTCVAIFKVSRKVLQKLILAALEYVVNCSDPNPTHLATDKSIYNISQLMSKIRVAFEPFPYVSF